MPQPSRHASSAVEPLEGLVRAGFERRLDKVSRAPIALALSGGGDSIALLHFAAAWAAEHGRPLLALTVDHGLNCDSAVWTGEAGEAARAVGAAWRALAWTGPKPASGLPAAARAARHRLLADAAREAGASVLLTGHTGDDLLEGDLIRAETPQLGRMSDWDPSPAWPEGRRVFLCRPLLGLRRANLRAWLHTRAISWLDDPANEDERYARARARLRLSSSPVPTGEGEHADAWWRRHGAALAPPTAGGGPLPPLRRGRQNGLIDLPRSADARTLSAALLCAAGTTTPPRGEALHNLLARLQAGEDFTATLVGARLVAEAETVLIGRDPGRQGLPTVHTAPGQRLVWDGRFELVAEAGAVVPLAGRLAQLSPQDRAEIAVLPAWARPTVPAYVHLDGRVALARGTPLGPVRLRAALGQIGHESDI